MENNHCYYIYVAPGTSLHHPLIGILLVDRAKKVLSRHKSVLPQKLSPLSSSSVQSLPAGLRDSLLREST